MRFSVSLLVVGWLAAPGLVLGQDVRASEAKPPSEQEPIFEEEPAAEKPGYRPMMVADMDGTTLSFPLSIAERALVIGDFPIDADGTRYESEPTLDTAVRVGLEWNSQLKLAPVRIVATYEHDLVTGPVAGGSDTVSTFVPGDEDVETQIRKAMVQLDLGTQMHLLAGLQTSHWGMGLLANDGAHGWQPGSMQFNDPRGGDRVLRGALLLGPFTNQSLAFVAGFDSVVGDDIMLEDDEAVQGVLSAVWGFNQPNALGVYGVVRRQEAPDGGKTDVQVLDLHGQRTLAVGEGTLVLETEAAFVWGETELGPSVDFPVHDVARFGAAARGTLDMGLWGTALDLFYGSGDPNLDDGSVNDFRADVNFPLGLIAHRYVAAAQTARGVFRASDPDLVGRPNANLDRLPTRRAITNTFGIFPRGMWRPATGLELYGGPLLLFTPEPLIDPFNTRIAGGVERNALDGNPGSYLGTETDLGLRYRRLLWSTELTLGLEGGVFLPGSALGDSAGQGMAPVAAARLLVNYRF